jgi:hypothetical protein
MLRATRGDNIGCRVPVRCGYALMQAQAVFIEADKWLLLFLWV